MIAARKEDGCSHVHPESPMNPFRPSVLPPFRPFALPVVSARSLSLGSPRLASPRLASPRLASQIVTVDFHNFRANARACPINAPRLRPAFEKSQRDKSAFHNALALRRSLGTRAGASARVHCCTYESRMRRYHEFECRWLERLLSVD